MNESDKSKDQGNKIVELNKSQFKRVAHKYFDSSVHSNTEDLEFIIEIIKPQAEWKCLDIATGAGHLAVALSPHVESIIASDITQEMLDQTQKLVSGKGITNVFTKIVDVHEIPFPDNSFDFVGCRIAAHHFHDLDHAIYEMIRVLKSGGTFYIQDTLGLEDEWFNNLFNHIEKLRDPSHFRDRTAAEWISLIEKHHVDVMKFFKRKKIWYFKEWTDRMNTSEDNKQEILKLFEETYENISKNLRLRKTDDDWLLEPFNGYFVCIKQ
jgi:ubiquinone/menaquinone biosynthesis C-methylase UbiE